jgi:predicted nucleotidyltransferase
MPSRRDENLERILDTVVRVASPLKVILFGSRARGHVHVSSDYDLLVVAEGVVNEREVTRKINRALFEEGIEVPVDVIVVDPARFERSRQDRGNVCQWGASEGEVVYG